MLAAGARSTTSVFRVVPRSTEHAPCQKTMSKLIAHRDLSLKSDGFLVVGVDGDGAEGVFARFAAVTALEEDSAQKNVGVDQFWIPEDGCLQGCDCRFLIAPSKIDATAE